MNHIFKSRSTVLALGIAGLLVMSVAPASAETVVRDHRDPPVVRDHRAGQPVVRDHRTEPAAGGGVTVTSNPRPRKPPCLGNLC
ncbi:MAG TPA: hypothetical protein VJR30_18345 [Bradyrhizobium sp.]|nr:hypothetical protein [Bradyrhizobium sp.]